MPDRPPATLAILAKAPIPGYAKTRLIPRLGPEGAAELQAVLLERTVRLATSAMFDSVTVWCAPDQGAPGFGTLRDGRLTLRDQPAGDLGARMLGACRVHLAAGGPVVLIGTDCPQLAAEHLAQARAALADGVDAVLVPAEDGGYAAIGLARADASLFEGVPWGTAEVLAVTRERLRRLGWTAHELSPVRDVDVPEDFEWLLASGLLDGEALARIARRSAEASRRAAVKIDEGNQGGIG